MSTPETSQPAEASSSSGNNPPSYDESRQEAGPLPQKRGELGFVEGVHAPLDNDGNNRNADPLPARHPAERDAQSSANQASSTTVRDAAQNGPDSTTSTNQSSTPSTITPGDAAVKPRILRYLKPKLVPGLGGVRLMTFLAAVAQLLIIVGIIVGWVFTGKQMAMIQTDTVPGGEASIIFIHVVFAFVMIGNVVFMERRVYRIRAERYAFKHPGAMLPRYRDRGEAGGDLSFAYAPWNRPPLPTYAAVLAQSGHGTGDADDHLIAVPPPPAYGNTRGSRMLLQGFLSDTQRAERPASMVSTASGLVRTQSVRTEGGREQQREQTLARLEAQLP